MTVDDLFKKCFEGHWDCDRFNVSGHSSEVLSKYKNHIKPAFGKLDYLSVTRVMVRDFHKSFSKTPVTGNRLLEIISKLYKYSIEREWNQSGFNPVVGVKHFTERKRKRYASEAEIKKIGEILDRCYREAPVEITFLYCLLFSGARPRSIERARWSELAESGGYGVLTFFGKSSQATGDEESVIIPPKIMEMIHKLPKRQDGLIFGIPLPGYLWRKIRKEAGCNDLWARDFRRTYATVGMDAGIKMDTIGKLLNHHSTQTTTRYALLNQKPRIEAVHAIASKLDEILKK